MHLTKGTFLIGAPEIEKGLYFRSVVLICEHNITGSFGLVINKPLNIEFPQELLPIDEKPNPNISILSGGIIQPGQMLLLHSCSLIPDQTISVCPGVFLGGDLEFLQKQMQESSGAQIRLCFGYSAWTSGQLEKEIMSGAWFTYPATEEIVFHTPPQKIWSTLLKNMGGKYSNLSMIPHDLSLN